MSARYLKYVYAPGVADHLAAGWLLDCPYWEHNGNLCWIMLWICDCKVPK